MQNTFGRKLGISFLLAVALLRAGHIDAQVSEWLTTPDRVNLVAPQPAQLRFGPERRLRDLPGVAVDERTRMQTMDGFGFALTGGSAELLMKMNPAARGQLLRELFGGETSSQARSGSDHPPIAVSYLRVSIGSSDMNRRVFTYDDVPPGESDPALQHFSLGPDLDDVVPVLKEILAINPAISILATPWSAPSWMKTNGLPKGGSLKPEDYGVYAHYLARYVHAMQAQGIRIAAITPQNEPLNPDNTPSMVMSAEQEAAFIKQALGPTFREQGLKTAIIIYDHNCDRPDYPLTILGDKEAAQYVDGSGFHLYGGEVGAMTQVHDAFPEKNIYFTEQMVVDDPATGPELHIAEPVSRVVIGATSNWARNVLLWNLAADPGFGPHTNDGGCPVCEGAITLDGDSVTRNLGYYTIAQIARFVPPGSVHILTTAMHEAPGAEARLPSSVAFHTPDGKTVLLVANPSSSPAHFAIHARHKAAEATLAPGAAATFVW